MNSRKEQEERNLELDELITEKQEMISKLQKELQEQKRSNFNQKRVEPGKSIPDLARNSIKSGPLHSSTRGVNALVGRQGPLQALPKPKIDIGPTRVVSRHNRTDYIADEDQGCYEMEHDIIRLKGRTEKSMPD